MNKDEENKKNTSGKKFLNVFAFAFLFFIIFCTAVIFFTTFRHWLLVKTTDVVNRHIIADIYIKDIRFFPFKGLIIDELTIITDNDTLADINRIIIKPSFTSLFSGDNIIIDNVELINPNVKLLRSEIDSLWNFKKIFKPSANVDTTASEPSKIIVVINNINMANGRFMY